MNQDKYIFSQLTEFLPQGVFDRIVREHRGNKYVKSFTCLEPDAVNGLRPIDCKGQYEGPDAEP